MATFTRRTVYKNGGASYSREGVKASIYVGPKNFTGDAPETVEFDCANLAQPGAPSASAEAKAEKAAAREAAKAEKAAAREAAKAERAQAREAAKVAREAERAQAKLDREAKRQAAIDAARPVSSPEAAAVTA